MPETNSQQPRSVTYGTFTIERTYPASPAQVYQALTDPAAKAKWFASSNQMTVLVRELDARPGGRELVKGKWENGVVSTFDAIYHDVIPNERIIYSYDLLKDDRKISVSLATFEISRKGSETTLKLTEQGAFLDGYDDAGSREHGSNFLLDALGASLT